MSSKKQKLTPWFQPRTPPARVGVYEVESPFVFMGCYAYWDGRRFGYRTSLGPHMAYECRACETCLPPVARWRGLAEDPNA